MIYARKSTDDLRHTFISNLAAGGVHPKTAQTLARHSTFALTMERYSHSRNEAELAAIKVLPDLSPTNPGSSVLADCLAEKGSSQAISVDSGGLKTDHSPVPQTAMVAAHSEFSNGEEEIRTPEAIADLPVFETARAPTQTMIHQ